MIQTKTEQEKQNEIRMQIEVINEKIKKINLKIYRLPYAKWNRLKTLSDEKSRLESKKNSLVNLLNVI